MTYKETRKFKIRVKIVDKAGQIHEFTKTEDFEIEWEGNIGSAKKKSSGIWERRQILQGFGWVSESWKGLI